MFEDLPVELDSPAATRAPQVHDEGVVDASGDDLVVLLGADHDATSRRAAQLGIAQSLFPGYTPGPGVSVTG